jgi:hypothetical protein
MKLVVMCSCLLLLTGVAIASAAAAEVSEKPSAGPKITSVSKMTTAQHQTITIKGTGFGTFVPYTGDSVFTSLKDLTKPRQWEAGYQPDNNPVTLIVNKWTNTEIVLGGFAGAWGKKNYKLEKGDKELIRIWNWQTEAGPASATVTIVAAP